MTTKEKARMKELERKDKAWKKSVQEFYRNMPEKEITGDELEYDGLTNEEFDECRRLQAKRYWDWVLTDNEKEAARFKVLQMTAVARLSRRRFCIWQTAIISVRNWSLPFD